MEDPQQIQRRKRSSNRSVLGGLLLIAAAVALDTFDLFPLIVTTAGAIVGFVLVMYGVHTGWLVFYERDGDGPPS